MAKMTITGRCYCGGTELHATQAPKTVTYCHCTDCRRVTGAPVAAFAAFNEAEITLHPNEGKSITANPGVTRTFCDQCGSPLTGRYDYLPGTIYIAIGLIDQAEELAPALHCHEANRYCWLNIVDDAKRCQASGREDLNSIE